MKNLTTDLVPEVQQAQICHSDGGQTFVASPLEEQQL